MNKMRYHLLAGVVTSIIGFILISCVHFYWSGILFSLICGALFGWFPDIDRQVKIIWGHRSPIFHSAAIPELLLLIAIISGDFTAIQFMIYWSLGHASHLLTDIFGKPSNGVTWYSLLSYGSLLLLSGLLAGVFLL